MRNHVIGGTSTVVVVRLWISYRILLLLTSFRPEDCDNYNRGLRYDCRCRIKCVSLHFYRNENQLPTTTMHTI